MSFTIFLTLKLLFSKKRALCRKEGNILKRYAQSGAISEYKRYLQTPLLSLIFLIDVKDEIFLLIIVVTSIYYILY